MITFMNMIAKTVARQVDRALSAAAARSVAAPQRGFVRGRRIDDNLYKVKGAFYEFSCCWHAAAMLLLDFRVAFPSLDRGFMFLVLVRMRIPAALCQVISALYSDLVTEVAFAGVRVAGMTMEHQAGLCLVGDALCHRARPHGAPMPGASDLRQRAFVCICSDVGVAMPDLRLQLRKLLRFLDEWGRASALKLNMQKCVLIPAGALAEAQAIVDEILAFAGLQVAHSGKYLGILVGPSARGVGSPTSACRASSRPPEFISSMLMLLACIRTRRASWTSLPEFTDSTTTICNASRAHHGRPCRRKCFMTLQRWGRPVVCEICALRPLLQRPGRRRKAKFSKRLGAAYGKLASLMTRFSIHDALARTTTAVAAGSRAMQAAGLLSVDWRFSQQWRRVGHGLRRRCCTERGGGVMTRMHWWRRLGASRNRGRPSMSLTVFCGRLPTQRQRPLAFTIPWRHVSSAAPWAAMPSATTWHA